MDISTNQAIVAACITASVGIISALVNIFINLQSRRNEKKLAILKILLEAAYKEYEFRTKQDLEEAKAKSSTAKIKSFTEYVIFYKQMGMMFAKDEITEQDIVSTLENNKKLIDTYYVKRDEFRPAYHAE